jgi:hypothetical protein
LVTIDAYPFGYATPQCPDPTSEESKCKRDGYAASFKALYRSYKRRGSKDGVKFGLTEQDFWWEIFKNCFGACAKRIVKNRRTR